MGLIGQRWDNFNLEVENTKLRLKEKIFAQSSGSYDRVIEYWPKGLSVIVMTSNSRQVHVETPAPSWRGKVAEWQHLCSVLLVNELASQSGPSWQYIHSLPDSENNHTHR